MAFVKRTKGVRKRATGGAYYLALEVLAQLPDRSREEWLAEEQIQGLAAPLATLASALAALGVRG